MCEATLHCLEVTNVQNFETLQYPIALLKGKIRTPCPNGKLQVVSKNRRPISSANIIENNNFTKNELREAADFRMVLRLSVGKNDFELLYCVGHLSITLHYQPPEHRYFVVPLYIICAGHTGHYQSDEGDEENDANNACRKITLSIELLQCVYAEKLYEHGFGRKTFSVGSPCAVFHSSLEWERSTTMTEGELWAHFAAELIHWKRYDFDRVKVVAFLSSTHFKGISDGDYSYENIRKKTTGHVALGGGGLALFGTGCLYTWPSSLESVCDAFASQQPVRCDKLLDDSNYRRTYGGCFATTLGSVCHEIGHTFDLGHTPDGSIMGDGVDGIDGVFMGPTGSKTGPKRLIETRPRGPSGRLTQLKRPGDVLRLRLEAKCNDGFFFAPNSAVTLRHHRWFNHNLGSHSDDAGGILNYDNRTRTLCGTGSPIVLVELRLTENGMMQKFWTFPSEKCQNSFTIPKLPTLANQTLFAMDASGYILKVDLNSIKLL